MVPWADLPRMTFPQGPSPMIGRGRFRLCRPGSGCLRSGCATWSTSYSNPAADTSGVEINVETGPPIVCIQSYMAMPFGRYPVLRGNATSSFTRCGARQRFGVRADRQEAERAPGGRGPFSAVLGRLSLRELPPGLGACHCGDCYSGHGRDGRRL